MSETNSLLKSLQVLALTDPSPETFEAEKELHQKWTFLREIEEAFFRQKSRINWLREGDLNTLYFHRICQVRASYNAVRGFLTVKGDWIVDPLAMSAHAISHFQSVLAPTAFNLVVQCTSPDWFWSLQPYRVSSHSDLMLSLPSAEEIKLLFFKLFGTRWAYFSFLQGIMRSCWGRRDPNHSKLLHISFPAVFSKCHHSDISTKVPWCF